MAKRKFMEYGEKPGTNLTLQEQRQLDKEIYGTTGKVVVSMLTIRQAHVKYMKRCRALRFVPETLKSYEDLMHMIDLYRPGARCSDVDLEFWNDFIIWLEEERKVKPATVNSYCKNLKAMFNWMIGECYIEPFEMKIRVFEKPLKEMYTDSELRLLLKKPDLNKATFAEYRCWVMINYFFSTGHREKTVLNLRIEDLDLENQIVALKQVKNKEAVLMPLSPMLCEILADWLKVRGDSDPKAFLFCKYNGMQMTKRGIEEAVRVYNRNRGVDKGGIHRFRHTFAYKYLKAKGDVFHLQRLMQHKSIETTKGYLNLVLDDLQCDYQDLNPLDNFIRNNDMVRPKFNVKKARK